MDWLEGMRDQVLPEILPVVDHVWNRRDVFIRWPARGGCWWPVLARRVTKPGPSTARLSEQRCPGCPP